MPAHKHAELIKAYADGAQIQYMSLGSWVDIKNPSWYDHFDYRIKPAPDIVIIQNYQVSESKSYVFCENSTKNTQRVKWTLDGETGRIKSVELLDK